MAGWNVKASRSSRRGVELGANSYENDVDIRLTRWPGFDIKDAMVPLTEQVIAPDLIGEVRHSLGKTRAEFAELLGVTCEAVRSYEQGGRRPSARVVRVLTLLLASDRLSNNQCGANCWEIKRCSASGRRDCPAYRLNHGAMCWVLTGGFCSGETPSTRPVQAAACQECGVFKIAQQPGACPEADHAVPRPRHAAASVGGGRLPCGMPRPARALSSH